MIQFKQINVELTLIVLSVLALVLLNGCIFPRPFCGNGVCEQGETPANCPIEFWGDCPPVSLCGNGVCDVNAGENTTNCLSDCPQTQTHAECINRACVSVSGSGINQCQNNTDCQTCPQGQIMHKGICKPKILDLTLNYNYSEIQKFGRGDGDIFDKVLFDFNYPSLVSKAQELSRNKVNTYDKVYAISNYIYNSKTYRNDTNPPVDSIQSYWDMNNGKCFHAAQLTQAMLNDVGIPALHYDVYSTAHAQTLVNIDGMWGVIDTTFHKMNPTDSDFNISLPTLESMRNMAMYVTRDYVGMYDSAPNNFCNMDNSLCLQEQFSMLRTMVNSSYPQQTLFVPLAYKFYTQTDNLRRYYGCELPLPYNCWGGCVENPQNPEYNAKIGYPITGATYPPFSYSGISAFDANDSDYIRQLIGYVKLTLPKNNLPYIYTCYVLDPSAWSSEPPAPLHAVASYSFTMDSPNHVKISGNVLQKDPKATQDEFDDLITYIKSTTQDLGINPE